MDIKSVLLIAVCIAGIYSAYLTQGVLSEQLATKFYSGQRFSYLPELNAAQSVVCFIVAYVLLLVRGELVVKDAAPFYLYWKPSVSHSIGPALGMEALKNISYSAQVLVKSSKMIPVMLIGTVWYQQTYSPMEYLCAGLIGGGISLFAGKTSKKAASKLVSPNLPLGYTLCLLNLLLDGYTNAAQDDMIRKYKGNKPLHMMCWMNFWTGIFCTFYMFVVARTGLGFIHFCLQHPEAGWDSLLFCLCGAWGQLFIFFTINHFGSLVNTMICTTRKFFNILLSAVWLGSPLLPNQWVAVVMVFLGIFLNIMVKQIKHRHAYSKSKAGKKAAADIQVTTQNGRTVAKQHQS